jgi:1,4-alpha-glucan branching enzyme
MIINEIELKNCISGQIGNPHAFLGLHSLGGAAGLVARAFDPYAEGNIEIIDQRNGKAYLLNQIHSDGFYEGTICDQTKHFPYIFRSVRRGVEMDWADPYGFLPYIQNEDLAGFNNGTDRRPFEKLGSFPSQHNGVEGVAFVVWAPSAKSVHLIGDFNNWHPSSLPMRSLGSSGCREIFVPEAKIGDKYKYRILGADDVIRDKTDPFGFRFEPPPGNATIIYPRSFNSPQLSKPASQNPRKIPVSIYEMHLGSWKFAANENRPLSYLELAEQLPSYLNEMGFSHVEFLPLSEYPYGKSWGYQVTGFYAPTHRYGTPDEFKVLVESCENAGVGVILDWVPAHFPSDDFALASFDGTCLFEHEDPKQGRHAEWDTLIFNYGRSEVRSFLIGSAICWLERFGVSGFRVDAVASMLYLDYGRKEGEWIPNKHGGKENLEAVDFIRQFNEAIHQEFPHAISIAEESTAFPQITQPPHVGGLGFDFKWNMGWMHDVLSYFQASPAHRSSVHNNLTFGATYQFTENFVQAFSHDEVVHGKGSLANKMGVAQEEDRLANLRSLLALQWTWPGKKTLFMGCEFGQWKEWDCDGPLDWALLNFPLHSGLTKLVADLNHLYLSHPSWSDVDHEGDKFQWIDCNDSECQTISFLKFGEYSKDTLLVACNFSDQTVHRDWGCPHEGEWEVILDSDAPHYGGEGSAGGTKFVSFSDRRNDQAHGLTFAVGRWSVRILTPQPLGN